MTTYHVERLADPSDLDGVLAVEDASFTNPWTREMYEWELRDPDRCRIYVVRSGAERVVAFCSLWLILDEIHINNVAVLPAHRGRGVGCLLMRHVLRESGRDGARRATLEVRDSNAVALRLYARLGFVLEGRRRVYYTNPVEDALILWCHELGADRPPA